MQILLAEDEIEIRKLVTMGMRINAMPVETVANGREAVEQASLKAWDLIMLDLNMPVLNGMEAAEQIRALPMHCNTPILFLSGDDQAFEVTVDNCHQLAKPFTIRELATVVKSLLANSAEPI